jgi:hypothetical protein
MATNQKKLDRIKTIITIVAVSLPLLGGSITFAWCKFARPDIDNRIEVKTNPIVDALEFNNYLTMEALPDSIVDRAIKKYTNSKKGRVK